MSHPNALRVADLSQNTPTPFTLRPDASDMAALAEELAIQSLRKLSFVGQIAAQGNRDWVLTAKLGATVVQPCVVTLDPVTTRIDTQVKRVFLADLPEPEAAETEMDDDDSIEKLGNFIDPAAVMAEALALALPLYPRKSDVNLGEAVFTKPGLTPMRDEDAKPFAGLTELRDALKKGS